MNPDQSAARPEKPGLTKLTMYRCGCGAMSQYQERCLNLTHGAHDNVEVRWCSEPVEFIAGADVAALIEWGDHAWKLVDELRAEANRVG